MITLPRTVSEWPWRLMHRLMLHLGKYFSLWNIWLVSCQIQRTLLPEHRPGVLHYMHVSTANAGCPVRFRQFIVPNGDSNSTKHSNTWQDSKIREESISVLRKQAHRESGPADELSAYWLSAPIWVQGWQHEAAKYGKWSDSTVPQRELSLPWIKSII